MKNDKNRFLVKKWALANKGPIFGPGNLEKSILRLKKHIKTLSYLLDLEMHTQPYPAPGLL